jgi:membrane associated rhomboid family serine protease
MPAGPISAVLLGLVVACTAVEAVLWGADLGLWATPRLRLTVYEWGGFWPGLLQGWQPNYSLQPGAMFLTYAFLHGGPIHLIVNMITLWSLGTGVISRVGTKRFVGLYLGTALGGAAGYGVLADSVRPMVGASGALFGLAGALLAWAYVDRFTARIGLWPIGQMAIFLVAMNIAMYWALDGQLAWQTHLGGFVAGWILALIIDPRPQP